MPLQITFRVDDEFTRLHHVVMGTGEGYHRNPAQVEVVNGKQARTIADTGHPNESWITREFASFRTVLEKAGVTVHQPVLAPASVQDQTCPRDIGFVIGDTFVTAGMRNVSRVEEITGIEHILGQCTGPRVSVPDGVALEGGDVIAHGDIVFVGCGQRSDPAGTDFLQAQFGHSHAIVPLPTKPVAQGEDILHLDCTFNPLGLGHALIYPDGLAEVPDVVRNSFDWIEVTKAEADELATNVFSVAPDRIIARSAPSCRRVNAELRRAGYHLDEVDFDAVPGTGGSFRCATLPLNRA